jgi:hypothetical protein
MSLLFFWSFVGFSLFKQIPVFFVTVASCLRALSTKNERRKQARICPFISIQIALESDSYALRDYNFLWGSDGKRPCF